VVSNWTLRGEAQGHTFTLRSLQFAHPDRDFRCALRLRAFSPVLGSSCKAAMLIIFQFFSSKLRTFHLDGLSSVQKEKKASPSTQPGPAALRDSSDLNTATSERARRIKLAIALQNIVMVCLSKFNS
jgi:hypothetical protein